MYQILVEDFRERARHKKGRLIEDFVAEVLEILQGKARKTFEGFETAWRLHLGPAYFYGQTIEDAAKGWELYKSKQRVLTPGRKLGDDRKAFSRVLHYAHKQGVLLTVPKLPLDAIDTRPPEGREIENEEALAIRDQFRKTKKGKWQLKLDIRAATGMRGKEISVIEFSRFDENGVYEIDAETAKTRRTRRIKFPEEIFAKIKELEAESNSRYLFPKRGDPSQPETGSQKAFQRAKKKLGLNTKLHWFRHTSVSRAIRAGMPGDTVQKVHGMSAMVMKRVYHQVSEEDIGRVSKTVWDSYKQNLEEK